VILLPARASQIARLLMNSYSFLVELYGSSTQECGVDRDAESSDTSSLNERLGIFGERKIFAGLLCPADLWDDLPCT
jgi:hypothetical protein